MSTVQEEIAATAARMVVEEGLEYGPAKRRAVKQLGLNARAQLPNNDVVEDAVREYLEIFCAETQPAELQALRELAAVWMARLSEFRPHLGGALSGVAQPRRCQIFICNCFAMTPNRPKFDSLTTTCATRSAPFRDSMVKRSMP